MTDTLAPDMAAYSQLYDSGLEANLERFYIISNYGNPIVTQLGYAMVI